MYMDWMSELSGKDFKEGIIKILQQSTTCSLQTSEKQGSLNEEIEVIKKNQMEITELKNKTTKTKSHWMGSIAE